MKKKNIVLVVVALAFASSVSGLGCTSTWWQSFLNNPIEQTQVFEQSVQTALSTADFVWAGVVSILPADMQVKAQVEYTKVRLSVNKALVALADAVQAAVIAKSPAPDFGALITVVSDAVGQILAIIDQYKAVPTPIAYRNVARPEVPVGYDDLQTAVQSMRRIGHVK